MKHQFWAAAICLAAATPAAASEPLALTSRHSARANASLLIELVSWHCIWNNRNTVFVDGKIKNISEHPVPKLAALIVVTDEDGKPIGDGDKFVDKAPLTPEMQANFKGQITLAEGSKRPHSCSIDFADGDGTILSWRESGQP